MFDALRENKGDAQQIIGREGETATLLSRCPFSFGLRGFGFAPRQFGRSAFRVKFDSLLLWKLKNLNLLL